MKGRQFLLRLCEAWGLVGGVALLGCMLAMMITVIGGAFGSPLLGDSEIIELLGARALTPAEARTKLRLKTARPAAVS